MRKLASIRKIDDIRAIEGADAIEAAIIGGWAVVIKKGEFKVGDLAVYLEIDSWVPTELAPFLSKGKEPREFNGIKGERLRTVKLRGQVSQGLLLPLEPTCANIESELFEGLDVSFPLNIVKWEAPVPAQLAGQVRGTFPGFIPKTDQERIQNLTRELSQWQDNPSFTWEVTEKLDGSSMTVYVRDEDEGVCSRNLELKRDENNTFWKVAIRESLIEKVRGTKRNLALQGELIGEGIQGNMYKISGHEFRLFDIYDIDRGDYVSPQERRKLCSDLGIPHVPLVAVGMVVQEHVTGLLAMAEGKSMLNMQAEREGLVFKCNSFGGPSFKAISNKFLLGEK